MASSSPLSDSLLSAKQALSPSQGLGKIEIRKIRHSPLHSSSKESKVSTPKVKESPSAMKKFSTPPLKESLSMIKKKISYRKKLVRDYAKKKVITEKMKKNTDATLSLRDRLLSIILNEELEDQMIASSVNQILRQELRKRLQWYISTNRQYSNEIETSFDTTEMKNDSFGSVQVSSVLKKARQRLKEKK